MSQNGNNVPDGGEDLPVMTPSTLRKLEALFDEHGGLDVVQVEMDIADCIQPAVERGFDAEDDLGDSEEDFSGNDSDSNSDSNAEPARNPAPSAGKGVSRGVSMSSSSGVGLPRAGSTRDPQSQSGPSLVRTKRRRSPSPSAMEESGGSSSAETERPGAGSVGITPAQSIEAARAGGLRRNRKKNKRRRVAKAAEKAARHPLDLAPQPRMAKYSTEDAIDVCAELPDADVAAVLPVSKPAFIGKEGVTGVRKVWALLELLTVLKFRKPLEWDGLKPRVLVDKHRRIFAVLAGRPDDPTWEGVHKAVAKILEEERPRLNSKVCQSRNTVPLSAGISYGGGQTGPMQKDVKGRNVRIVERLLADHNVQRMAGFGSHCFSRFAPKQYEHMAGTVREVIDHHERTRPRHKPSLKMNFKNSAYPMAVWNFGPGSASSEHLDYLNGAGMWCSITSMGEFDSKRGGHLILFDLDLVIEFPAGSTILIPSASLRHGNTPVGENETRYSFTQFCAGGFARWVRYGFQGEKELSDRELKQIESESGARLREVVERFSKVCSLVDDQNSVFKDSE